MTMKLRSIAFLKSTLLNIDYEKDSGNDISFVELDAHWTVSLLLSDLSHEPLAEVTFCDRQTPTQMGTSVCRIRKIEGQRIYFEGLNLVNGTAILDIKAWSAA